jgi:60 kDa SS-A/Ro ribonucleoprotein
MNLSATKTLNSCEKEIFKVSNETFLKRFLFLGVTNGTYYIKKENLIEQHIDCIMSYINNKSQHLELLEIVKEYINKAFKKDYILFILARCCIEQQYPELRNNAYVLVNEICQIPTHLFLFIDFYELLSKKHYNSTGWNKMHKKFIKKWYLSKDPNKLLYLITKYKNRNNWTHKDVLKLSHIKTPNTLYDTIFKYITTDYSKFLIKISNNQEIENLENLENIKEYIKDYETIKNSNESQEIVELINKQSFVREHIDNSMLNNIEVWNALSKKIPFTAMLRNINKLTQIGLFEKYPDTLIILLEKLNSKEAIIKSKVHPLQILISLQTYSSGKGLKGSLTWTPNKDLCNSLNNAFLLAFDNVQKTGKRYMVALDCSGSMSSNSVCGIECLNARELSCAFSMILKNIEPNCEINGFSEKFIPLNISPLISLETNIKTISNLPFNNTDCSIPMMNAISHDKKFDVFIIITDNETNCNEINPCDALKQYREFSDINAKLVVVAMSANKFSIADPNDPYMLDVCGFSPETFDAIQEFILL